PAGQDHRTRRGVGPHSGQQAVVESLAAAAVTGAVTVEQPAGRPVEGTACIGQRLWSIQAWSAGAEGPQVAGSIPGTVSGGFVAMKLQQIGPDFIQHGA